MREIKFRAWDGIKMLKHIYSHTTPEGWLWIDNPCKVGVKALMQYTGLKDKNGKEIYEFDYLGDYCVFWGSGEYILQNISTGDIMDCNEKNTNDKEITGNRFETPREHPAMETDL